MIAMTGQPRQSRHYDRFAHFGAIALYTLLFGVALLLRPVIGDERWLLAQAIVGALMQFMLWQRLDWRGERFLSFGAIVLLAGAVNHLLYALDVLINGIRLDQWPFASDSEWSAVARGEWMTVVGLIVVCYFWRTAGGVEASAVASGGVVRGDRGVVGYWILYVCAVGLEVLRQYGVVFTGAAQLAMITYASGLGAVVALNGRDGSRSGSAIRAPLMCIPLAYLALGTGMKESIIIAMLPLTVVLWRRFTNYSVRFAFAAIALILIAFVTSFVGHYRERAWIGSENVSIAEALGSYTLELGSQPEHFAGEGFRGFLARNNATYHRGWTVDLADREGFEPGSIFGELSMVFIPRFLWPAKPDIEPGREHSARLFGDTYVLYSTSSLAAGFFPALYLGGGWLALILISPFTGWMIGSLHKLLLRYGSPYSISAFSWILLLYGLRLDETWPIYALSSPIISLVYVAFLGGLIYVLLRFLEPKGIRSLSTAMPRLPRAFFGAQKPVFKKSPRGN